MSYGSQSHQLWRECVARAANGHPRDAEPYATTTTIPSPTR